LADNLYWASTRDAGYGPYYYPLATGERELIEEIQLLHPGKHVVVTNGGKQAIAASLYAFRSLYNHSSANHAAPYWPSYPTLIKAAGLMIEEREGRPEAPVLRLATLINNPNGFVATDSDLLDCAYGHPVYGWEGEWPEHKVSIWSAAKLFGTAGLRLGWLVTDDADFAAKAAFHEEITTSGVSVLSQRYGAKLLKYQRENKDVADRTYDAARQVLIKNGDTFNQLLGSYCSIIQGVPFDGRGMFAWFQVAAEHQEKFSKAISDLKIKLVTGNACGVKEAGWYRMSMGHRINFTQEALEKLNTALI
jgi:aspartate/methionine/tyrosine aminotransferase